ncbi:hypothetical protein FEM41_20235 [Jejubacter calystegiae]|uniref:Uncharacterized protein n=1 Tax=Jejubacter calystegiae TaxID=2579935 RepID=A0A4P8YNV3_9ENTR|nr:hypothetical protein [Jejubacter calystegiae]QCT21816.1 hypothetical protein FEM41_20235 [Jejubacter calystegiae]
MASSLLEACNDWQIQRAEILNRNQEMKMTIKELDEMILRAVNYASFIAHRVDWDFHEAEKRAKEIDKEAEQ